MRQLDYTDERGRIWRVELPDGVPDDEAALGVPVGPPAICDALALPEAVGTRLHNELHRRKLYTLRDVQGRPGELHGALMAALRLDTQTIVEQYAQLEKLQ